MVVYMTEEEYKDYQDFLKSYDYLGWLYDEED